MQRSWTIHDLPKTALITLKGNSIMLKMCINIIISAESEIDISSFIVAALHGKKKCLIHHESFTTWLKELLPDGAEFEFLSFSGDQKIALSATCESKEIIFLDFDVYVDIHGWQKTMILLNEWKNHKKIYLVCPPHVATLNQLEVFATANISIHRKANCQNFECTTVFFDKKGNTTTSTHEAILTPDLKLIFKSSRGLETVFDDHSLARGEISSKTEKVVQAIMDLPFFSARQEDGVAIRDAATRKIRVGGQVVYEPDRDDDLDDSDPDDDLNI